MISGEQQESLKEIYMMRDFVCFTVVSVGVVWTID